MTTNIDFHEAGKDFKMVIRQSENMPSEYNVSIYRKLQDHLLTPVSVYILRAKSAEKAADKVREVFIKSNGKRGFFDLELRERITKLKEDYKKERKLVKV